MKWNKLFAKLKKPLIIAGCTLAVAFVAGFFLNCLFTYNFKFRADINLLVDGKTYLYAFLLSVIALTVVLAYYYNHTGRRARQRSCVENLTSEFSDVRGSG